MFIFSTAHLKKQQLKTPKSNKTDHRWCNGKIQVKWCQELQRHSQQPKEFASFEKPFQQHSIKMVQEWFIPLQDKDVMATAYLNTLTAWINKIS